MIVRKKVSIEPVKLGTGACSCRVDPFHFFLNLNAGISIVGHCVGQFNGQRSSDRYLHLPDTGTILQLRIYWRFFVSNHIITEIKSPTKLSIGIIQAFKIMTQK